MKTVLKYQLSHNGRTGISLPANAKLLHVANQQGLIQLWVCVDSNGMWTVRDFLCVYTGFDVVPENAVYVGTAISADGSSVTHVYELI